MPEFTDTYLDTLVIHVEAGNLYFTVEEEGRSAQLEFSLEGALEIAQDIVNEVRQATGETPATIFGSNAEDERGGWNLDALQAAIEYNRQARFSYEKESGPGGIIEARSLAPEAIHYTRAGEPLVIGYDPDRDAVRAFRLDRIIGYVEVS